MTNYLAQCIETPVLPHKQEVSVAGVAFNRTSLKGENTARFTDSVYTSMREHFNNDHIKAITKRVEAKYHRHEGLMVTARERSKRRRLNYAIELKIGAHLNAVPDEYVYQRYNPMIGYHLFSHIKVRVRDESYDVYVNPQGRGAGSRITYTFKSGVWLREAALLRFKRTLEKDIEPQSVEVCRDHIKELEQILADGRVPISRRPHKVETVHDYNYALEMVAQDCLNAVSLHNQESRAR